MNHRISACLVVCNEEAVIERCLESLGGAVDEIVVVHDGPCQDRTLEICRRYTDRIFVRPRIGSAEPHRVFSMEQATAEWVLWIDADEYLTEGLRDALPGLARRDDVNLFCFLWPYTDGKRDLTLGLDHPYRSCMARRSAIRFLGIVDEPLRAVGAAAKVPLILGHRPKYDNYTWDRFLHKWEPRNRLKADYIWRSPDEIPSFGDWTAEEKLAYLDELRRRPLVSAVWMMGQAMAWHTWKGMWRLGPTGLKITFLTALNLAAVRWWVFRRRPRGGPGPMPSQREAQ